MKKTIYLILTSFLGLSLSIIGHAVIEVFYLKYLLANNLPINWSEALGFGGGQCALPVIIQWLLLILGISWGYFVGQRWWRYVYIEKKHWRFKNIKT